MYRSYFSNCASNAKAHKSCAQYLVYREAALSQSKALLRATESSYKSWILQQWTREKWLDQTSLVSDKEMKDAGASRGSRRVDEPQLGKHLTPEKANQASAWENYELWSVRRKCRSSCKDWLRVNVLRRLVHKGVTCEFILMKPF